MTKNTSTVLCGTGGRCTNSRHGYSHPFIRVDTTCRIESNHRWILRQSYRITSLVSSMLNFLRHAGGTKPSADREGVSSLKIIFYGCRNNLGPITSLMSRSQKARTLTAHMYRSFWREFEKHEQPRPFPLTRWSPLQPRTLCQILLSWNAEQRIYTRPMNRIFHCFPILALVDSKSTWTSSPNVKISLKAPTQVPMWLCAIFNGKVKFVLIGSSHVS